MAAAAAAANAVAVSRLAWPEFMSALARRARESARDAAALALARQEWVARWPDFVVVEINQPLMELAGDYAEAFALRAYDSVQLAAMQTLRQQSGEDVRFACFDSRLVKAAAVLKWRGRCDLPAPMSAEFLAWNGDVNTVYHEVFAMAGAGEAQITTTLIVSMALRQHERLALLCPTKLREPPTQPTHRSSANRGCPAGR
jgi:predicted nucleic acid-binding protein